MGGPGTTCQLTDALETGGFADVGIRTMIPEMTMLAQGKKP